MNPNSPEEKHSDAPVSPETPKPLSVRITCAIHDTVEMFVFSAIAVMLLFTCGLRMCVVRGDSMEQTLSNLERLAVIGVAYTPQQGDIVVFHQTDLITYSFNEPIVKRVIATEGQWVDVDRESRTVTVYDENMENPQVLDESAYAYYDTGEWWRNHEMRFPARVPEGHIFVMGDNRNNSSDSASSEHIGFVDARRVLGRVVYRLTPLHKAGPVT